MNAASLDHTSWEGANSRRTLVSIPASEDGRVVPITSSLPFLKGISSLLDSLSRGGKTSSLYQSPILIFRHLPRCLRYLVVVVVRVSGMRLRLRLRLSVDSGWVMSRLAMVDVSGCVLSYSPFGRRKSAGLVGLQLGVWPG